MKRLIIFNPKSRNAESQEAFIRLQRYLVEEFSNFEIYRTKAPHDATARVRDALKTESFSQILVAGGDGTVNEVVNGYFEDGKQLSHTVPFGILNLGTGGDFHKTKKYFSLNYEEAIRMNSFRLIDCGKMQIDGGDPHYFVNIASVGIGGEVAQSLKSSSFQYGAPAYFYHTVKSFIKFHPKKLRVRVQDQTGQWVSPDADDCLAMLVCNGKFSGGGMHWAPNCFLDDNTFDVVIIAKVSKWQFVMGVPKIYSGRIAEVHGVKELRSSVIEIECDEPLAGEVDGELFFVPEKQTVRFESVPQSLPIVL